MHNGESKTQLVSREACLGHLEHPSMIPSGIKMTHKIKLIFRPVSAAAGPPVTHLHYQWQERQEEGEKKGGEEKERACSWVSSRGTCWGIKEQYTSRRQKV